jgi:hypothetical protein
MPRSRLNDRNREIDLLRQTQRRRKADSNHRSLESGSTLFETMFTPCSRSGARYRGNWHIDDSDGALLFGLGVHRQYLFVNAEKLVVARGCCPTGCPLDAARIIATLRAVSAVRP